MPLEPGRSLAHYRIVRHIGEGGMGTVYLAEDTKLDRQVALKVLPPEMASDPDRLGRFQREAKAVAALNHPHIVTLYSVEEEGGTHFLTMELVDGNSLDRSLPPGGLPLAKVFDIGIALADALAAAHDKGIIHRDLKPANVMLTKDGRVKVLDFGLAKLAPGSRGRAPGTGGDASAAPTRVKPPDGSLTDAGLVVGTVPYMSPEQVGGETVDARTDIFSLGVVLYELVTGHRPFGGRNPAETISSILRDAPRPLSEARQDAPRPLGRIVEHCLQKDPESRFQTAKDVRNELRALRREMESSSSGVSSSSSAAAWRGHEAPPGTPPLSAAGSAPVSVDDAAPPSTAPGMAPRAGVSRLWLKVVAGATVVIAIVAAFWLGGRGGSESRPAGSATGSAAGTSPTDDAAVAVVNSLAVLPFVDMSPGKDQEYFSDGLTEELLNALVKIPDLKVTGRTSSFSFKGKNEDLRVIGEKLGVANLLEGSVRKSGDKVRITAQLVKAADGFHLWSETYDRTLNDVFAVQDDIAHAVAQALQVTLLGQGSETEHPDAKAYDLILQARYVMEVGTEDSLRLARKMLEQALGRSPDYAPAWAEMGLVHMREKEVATTVDARQEALRRQREALLKALELDPDLAVAHSRMAGVHRDSWEFETAEESTERALAADPRNPVVLGNAALLYQILGRQDEAILLQERMHALDPLAVTGFTNLANSYLLAGRLDEAEALCREAIALRPDDAVSYLVLGGVELHRGRPEDARSSAAKYNDLTGGGDYIRLWSDALVEHAAGNAEASRKAADEFERRFGADDPMSCAQIRAWRGENDAAFTWLDSALTARDPGMSHLKLDPWLTSLHTDPRWNALLRKIGLPTD